MEQSVTAKRRLVLHFDLNNTLLMFDNSKNLGVVDNVARIVCKSAWGRLSCKKENNAKAYSWELAHDQLTFSKPDSANLLANLPACETEDWSLATFMDYIDAAFPVLADDKPEADRAERESVRSNLRSKFSQPGGQGSKFKNTAEKLIKNLALPKGAKDELGIQGENGMEAEADEAEQQEAVEEDNDENEDVKRENARKAHDKRMLRELFSDGRYSLIPGFFRTLIYLKKQKQEFAVVFRTFGQDLKLVVHEFDKFARGEHPCFNGRNGLPLVKFDGSKNSKDFRFKCPEEQIGTLYRLGAGINEAVMVLGENHERVDHSQINHIDSDENTVIRDHLEIYQTILETLKKHSVMAIQEDFPAYKASGYSNDRAKMMLVDQADYNTQHIFFDDNADSAESCIVDVRDVITGEALPYKKFMDMYVVKVHPHRAILENDYFVKLIEQCEAKRDDEIRRVEAGIAEEEYEQVQKKVDTETEWEKL